MYRRPHNPIDTTQTAAQATVEPVAEEEEGEAGVVGVGL